MVKQGHWISIMPVVFVNDVGSRRGFSRVGTWFTLSTQNLSCVASEPIIFHDMVFISFKNKVCLWSWLSADIANDFVYIPFFKFKLIVIELCFFPLNS